MHTTDIGVRLEIRRIDGSAGPAPIVFLHEGLGSVSLWTQRGIDWPELLCRMTGRAGLVYSRCGYGQSDPAPGPRSGGHPPQLGPDYMHRQAWDVLPALLEAEGISRPVLMGHSDGATIALLHASRFQVTACIAMAPHVFVEDVAIASIAQAKIAFEQGGLKDRLARHHADVEGAFWQWNDVWLSQAFRSFDIRAECRQIRAPLLLVQGEDDEYGTMRQLDEIASVLPAARQLRLAQCGHSPQRDQPEKSAAGIAAFIATCG